MTLAGLFAALAAQMSPPHFKKAAGNFSVPAKKTGLGVPNKVN